jgi:hypothetical protein
MGAKKQLLNFTRGYICFLGEGRVRGYKNVDLTSMQIGLLLHVV